MQIIAAIVEGSKAWSNRLSFMTMSMLLDMSIMTIQMAVRMKV